MRRPLLLSDNSGHRGQGDGGAEHDQSASEELDDEIAHRAFGFGRIGQIDVRRMLHGVGLLSYAKTMPTKTIASTPLLALKSKS